LVKFIRNLIPGWQSVLLALLSAVLLVLSFPDFEYWFLAWFGLVPLLIAIEREKATTARSFIVGWIFGTAFFFGTCWWLTYAPITYAGFPWALAYSLILIACLGAGIFPAIFAAVQSRLLKYIGPWAVLSAPFAWAASEFLRYWISGNNWNALGYSQAFTEHTLQAAAYGGIAIVGFAVCLNSALISVWFFNRQRYFLVAVAFVFFWAASDLDIGKFFGERDGSIDGFHVPRTSATIIGVQPNVPMSGLDAAKLDTLRDRQVDAAKSRITGDQLERRQAPILVILPESPMNFMYTDDREFQQVIGEFARRNNVSVLFNSAEPDVTNGKYFNSAVMVGPDGRKVDAYDKIYLLPFGEAVPPPLDGILPGFVGNFSYGREYDLFPLGDARAGVMICFESHFGQLSREYVRNGADVLIEMTNDGYLGPTPVLRQHLANAVFRAVETHRPVLRVTNVGITAEIDEQGRVIDPAGSYQEATRVWSVSKSDGSQTFYVRFGDWFAWLCVIVTVALSLVTMRGRNAEARA
jgi:apolipoprotein N-acyltransferase